MLVPCSVGQGKDRVEGIYFAFALDLGVSNMAVSKAHPREHWGACLEEVHFWCSCTQPHTLAASVGCLGPVVWGGSCV